MKALSALSAIFCLISAVAMFAATKPYDGWSTTIFNSSVNKSNVRVINTKSIRDGVLYSFVFSCNEDEKRCTVPLVKQAYTLTGVSGDYQCDEYELDRDSNEPAISVCLRSVE